MGKVLNLFTDSLQNLVSRLGTERDKAAGNTYIMPTLTDQELLNAYRGAWLPRKIVDIPAFDSVRAWRNWQADADQIEKIEAEEQRLGYQAKVHEARIKARLWGGAAIFIGTGDADLTTELDVTKIKVGGIKYMTVLSRRQLKADELIKDVQSPWFGWPQTFTMTNGDQAELRIHPSRLIVFRGAPMPDIELVGAGDLWWGDPVLAAVMDACKQADATAANIASLVYEAKIDIIRIPNFMTNIGIKDYESKVLSRFTLAATAKGINGTLILDKEEEYESKTTSFANLPDVLDRFLQIVSGAADIPATRLLGQSPAGMNATGESDLRNYYDRLTSMQRLEMSPAMYTADEALIFSALGSRPDDIYYEWAPLWEMSEKEAADVFKTKADAARAIAGSGAGELIPVDALSDALVNTFTEDGSLPGLDSAIEEYGSLSEQEPSAEEQAAALAIEQQRTAAVANSNTLRRQAANDALPRSLYVRRDVLNTKEITAWAKSQGFTDVLPDLHVTIMYSRTAVDWFKVGQSYSDKVEIVGGPRQMEQLGQPDKPVSALLIPIVGELKWRFREMLECGCETDYPDYQPHITIAKGVPVDLSKVQAYQGKILLGPEIFEEVKP